MSTSPISSSSGFPPPASLPDDTPAQGEGEGPEILEVDDYQVWTPRSGGLADARDRPLPSPGLAGSTHGGQPAPTAPGQGQTPNPIADTTAPGTGKPQVGGDATSPGAGTRPPGGADTLPRPGINPGGQQGGGYSSVPGQNGQGNGNGYGLGNGNNGSGFGLGSTLGNLTNGLLGRGGVLAAPLAMLNGAAQGGLGNVLAHATPIPLATPNALPNAAAVPVHTPASTPNAPTHATPTSSTATGTSPFAGAPANASNASNATALPRANAPTTTPATTHSAMPAPTTTAAPMATPLRGGAIVENAPAQLAGMRSVNVDPAHAGHARGQAGAANDPHAPLTPQTPNAMRQGNVQALAPMAGTLTLMVSPHAELASEDTRATANSTLFREQGVDGRENVRDILGRTYVFTADGKLITRAQERTGVDAVDPTLADELDEVSMSNHGELSTHDLLFKVVVPAFAGMAALLGGATAGAGIATGASGMGGSFLLLAAAAVLGYGATRAIANLRELSATGADLSPLASRAAMTHWVAAGTQSTGSLAAVALMLF